MQLVKEVKRNEKIYVAALKFAKSKGDKGELPPKVAALLESYKGMMSPE